MQKFITKYGLAAHLALLAVAPLFLFPFVDSNLLATILLWLSPSVFVWVLMEPSIRAWEHLHVARRRVVMDLICDPLFWFFFVLIVMTAFRQFNGGIALQYDAETSVWKLREAAFPLLPGSIDGASRLPFASACAVAVVTLGCRHALGKAARMAFMLISATLAGIAATLIVCLVAMGDTSYLSLMQVSTVAPSYIGLSFGIYFLVGTVALVTAFEQGWRAVMPLFVFAIGGTGAGAFIFSPPYISVLIAGAAIVLILYGFVYAMKVLRGSGEFKCLVVYGMAITLGVLLVMTVIPPDIVSARVPAYLTGDFLSKEYMALRDVLSRISFQDWKTHPWLGSGLGTFPLIVRTGAATADWATIPVTQAMALNGYWQLLVERGIVGAVFFAVPLGLLLYSYFKRLVIGCKTLRLPHPAAWVALVAVPVTLVLALIDCSFLRAEVIVALGAILAVSANSFPKEKPHG